MGSPPGKAFTIEYPRVRQREKKFSHRGLRPRPLVVSVALLLWFFEKVEDSFHRCSTGSSCAVPRHGSRAGHGGPGRARHHPAAGDARPERVGKRILDALDRLIQRIPGTARCTPPSSSSRTPSPPRTPGRSRRSPGGVPEGGVVRPRVRTMTVEEGDRRLVVVYVPTNNLYLGEVLFHPRGEGGPARSVDRTGGPPARVGGIAAPRSCGECGAGLDKRIDAPYPDRTMMSAILDRQEVGLPGLALLRPGGAGPEPERVAHHIRRFGRGAAGSAVFSFQPREPGPGAFHFGGSDQKTVRRV